MTHRMPDHIANDGPRDPDDIPGLDDLEDDEDLAYENQRQNDIDDGDRCPECNATMTDRDPCCQTFRNIGDSLHNTLQDIASSPDPSGPIGECRYNCPDAEHVGDYKYVCLHPDHWEEAAFTGKEAV